MWNGTPNSCATAASDATGWTVPTSLLAHMMLTTAAPAGSAASAARSTSAWTSACSSTASQSARAPRESHSQRTESKTAWCSTAVVRIRLRWSSAEHRAQNRPFTARLSASVPPLVKITSLARAPNTSASCSRDSSTTRRARRPAACSDDGLPSCASSSVIAAMASGSIGVVAAWSR